MNNRSLSSGSVYAFTITLGNVPMPYTTGPSASKAPTTSERETTPAAATAPISIAMVIAIANGEGRRKAFSEDDAAIISVFIPSLTAAVY